MLEQGFMHSGLTRRSFLECTGAAASAVALAGLSGGTLEAFADETQNGVLSAGEEEIHRGVCRPNCFGYCHLNVHVHDGKVMKTTRAPYNERCYDRICQRGLSHVHRIYDPKRLQYPIRRVDGTERGAGQWERITWDEALDEIAAKMTEIQKKYGEDSIFFLNQSGNMAAGFLGIYSRFIAVTNASTVYPCMDQASLYGMQSCAGMYISPQMGMMNWNGNEPTDMKNAKTVITWGANVTDAQIHNWHLLHEARAQGTKLVVIDPIFTQIASKADMWIPIRPGSDTLLKLGLMQIVLDRNAQDEEFLKQHTVAPLLVKSNDGKFLRRSDMGTPAEDTGQVNPMTKQPIMHDPFMALVNGQLVELQDGMSPDIKGTYNHDGVECRCAYELLVENIYEHSLEDISAMTEIPLDTIYELADIVIDGPVFHYEGYGPQAYNNGGQTTFAGYTLCALLGNLGKPGASYGAFWGYGMLSSVANPKYAAPTGPSTGRNICGVDLKNVVEADDFMGAPANIKMFWIYGANPVSTHTETKAFTDIIFPAAEFIVTADSMLTDTAMYSDMVLPVAQWFELEDIATSGQACSMNYSEKSIEPLYECKTDFDIITELAKKMGLGEYFTMTNQEALKSMYSGPIAEALGTSYEQLKEVKQVRFIPGNAETAPYIAWENGTFPTESGRFEFYRETVTPRALTTITPTPEEIQAERLPHFEPPLEAWPDNPLHSTYPFVLMSERARYRVHSQWFATPLLRELDPEPIVKINPADAKTKGIEDQTYVECFNDRGSTVAKAIYSEAIRPGTLVYPKGWQMDQHKEGCWSCLSSTKFNVFTVNNNFMDVLCDIRPWKGEK